MKKNIRKLKEVKAITLIALVITIIVMLILVGVTITVVLQGGLFDQAKDAKAKTELEKDKELLMSAALGCTNSNGIVDFTLLDNGNNLPEGFTGSNGTYTKGGYTFLVDQYGTVTIGETGTGGELTDLEKYILGEEGTGRSILEFMNQQMQFIDDENTEMDESEAISLFDFVINDPYAYAYLNYNNDGNVYKVKLSYQDYNDMSTFRTEPISEIIGVKTIPTGSGVGTYVNFEAIIAAVEANPEEYLARAAAAGQNTSSNTDIGIGTDGNIVNLDLWGYRIINNEMSLGSIGTGQVSYRGTINEDGRIEGTIPQYIYQDGETLVVTRIGQSAFYGFSSLTQITIPNTVTSIDYYAFYECSSLESITIPNTVTSIENSAFSYCSSLESIIIDNTKNSISGSPWGASNAEVIWLR